MPKIPGISQVLDRIGTLEVVLDALIAALIDKKIVSHEQIQRKILENTAALSEDRDRKDRK